MMKRQISHVATGLVLSTAVLVGGCQSSSSTPQGSMAASPDLAPSESARLCLKAGRAFEQQGYEREAIVQYLRARQFDPSLASSLSHRLAVLYGRQGDVVHATAEFQSALHASPDDPKLLNDFGYFQLSQSSPAVAEKYFRRAVAADPTDARGWVNLGLSLGEQQQFDASYQAFTKVLSPAQAKANVGLMMAQQGQYPAAERTLKESLALDPTLNQPQAVLQWVDARLQGGAPVPTGTDPRSIAQ